MTNNNENNNNNKNTDNKDLSKSRADFSSIDYNVLFAFLEKEFFSVIEKTSPQQIGWKVSLFGASNKFVGVSLFRDYSSGGRLDVIVKPVYKSETEKNDFTRKMFSPNGLSFEFAYRNFLIPQSKQIFFSDFLKNDSGVRLIEKVSSSPGIFSSFSKKISKLDKYNNLAHFSDWAWDSANTYKKPYYFSIFSKGLFSSNLIPVGYMLRDVDALVSSMYRPRNGSYTNGSYAIGNSSLKSIFSDSFERRPISKGFDKDIDLILSEYFSKNES